MDFANIKSGMAIRKAKLDIVYTLVNVIIGPFNGCVPYHTMTNYDIPVFIRSLSLFISSIDRRDKKSRLLFSRS